MTGSVEEGSNPAASAAALAKADRIVLAIVCLAQFMVVLDISIVNVALPTSWSRRFSL